MITSSILADSSDIKPLKSLIKKGELKHIAIIMDGNRRWAQNRHLPASQGHYYGYKALRTIVEYCATFLGLPVLTVYAFSTENWQRSPHEVNFLLKLFNETLQKELQGLKDRNIRLKFLGNLKAFPSEFYEKCLKAESYTADCTGLLYQVALNYGSRGEIIDAVRKLAQDVKDGKLLPEEITEAYITENLYTGGTVDPDMIIRTGGEYRLSNFLLWQSTYSEICIVDELWPEFTPEILNRTILEFQRRQRRFGK